MTPPSPDERGYLGDGIERPGVGGPETPIQAFTPLPTGLQIRAHRRRGERVRPAEQLADPIPRLEYAELCMCCGTRSRPDDERWMDTESSPTGPRSPHHRVHTDGLRASAERGSGRVRGGSRHHFAGHSGSVTSVIVRRGRPTRVLHAPIGAPGVGLEPTTYGLTVRRSAS